MDVVQASSVAVSETKNQVSAYLETHPKLGCDVMEHLWKVLDVRYPGIWRSWFRSDKESLQRWKVEWAKAFAEHGITLAMIKRGLDNMVALHEKMPPSLPRFIELCQMERGVDVDPYEAFCEAQTQIYLRHEGRDRWSHPAIYWAAVRIGEFDLRNSTWDQIEKRWTAVLRQELQRDEIKPVPPALDALPAPGSHYPTREEVMKHLERIRKIMSGSKEQFA